MADRETKPKESILELSKYFNCSVRVELSGGRKGAHILLSSFFNILLFL